MKYQVAILITTFLRDSVLQKTIQSIVDNYTTNCIVLIADQGYESQEKLENLDYYQSQISLKYYKLPFDCGLSYARNFLIKKASEMDIPYILMGADSIQFTQPYNFQPIIDFLEYDSNRGIVGFELIGSKCPWEYLMRVDDAGIHLNISDKIIKNNYTIFKKVDICRNIFLAKTHTLLNLYDNDLKLCEHELAFLTYKGRNYEVYWTDIISFKKNKASGSEEYQLYRKRLGDFQKILKQKLGIKQWVIYSPEVMKEIREYKQRSS
jgi:glycosyltransferase involved in cell wall biosynthesis